MRTFSSLLVVTFIGVRIARRIGYRTSSTLMCIAVIELCHSTGGSHIYLPSESNGPNLLDESLKGFIVTMSAHLGSVLGVINPGIWVSQLTVKVYNLCRV